MGILRLLLAISVVIHHTPNAGIVFTNGGVAVQAFYVISGYFIAMVLSSKYSAYTTFYINRGLRLYPIYLVVLLLSAIQLFVAGSNRYLKVGQIELVSDPLSAFALIFANLTLIGQEWIVWFDVDGQTGALTPDLTASSAGPITAWRFLLVPQAWTLSLELAFYSVAPFLVKRRVGVIVAVASLAIRMCWDVVGVDYNLWVRRMFASEFCLFLLGVLAFRLTPSFVAFTGSKRAKIIGFASLAALVALVCMHSTLFGVTATGRAILFFSLAFSLPFIHHALGRNHIDRRIGDLSYPVYIVHILVIASIRQWAPDHAGVAVMIIATLIAAIILYLLIDRPVDALRQRLVAASPT